MQGKKKKMALHGKDKGVLWSVPQVLLTPTSAQTEEMVGEKQAAPVQQHKQNQPARIPDWPKHPQGIPHPTAR